MEVERGPRRANVVAFSLHEASRQKIHDGPPGAVAYLFAQLAGREFAGVFVEDQS
ncbi:MAG: hypothetical protein WA862_04980 [Solirubrobacterales bacterium]